MNSVVIAIDITKHIMTLIIAIILILFY